MRDAQQAAANAATTASQTAGGYGAQAAGIGSQLTPFLTRQLNNPAGMSQQDIGAQLTAGLAGAGGATAGLTGAAGKMASTTRNPMGFSSALDAAARERDKAGAGVGERVMANNANVKLDQQKQAAEGLSGLYGTDVGAQAKQASLIPEDIKAQMEAAKYGWMQQIPEVTKDIGSIAALI